MKHGRRESPYLVGCIIVLATAVSGWLIDAADSSGKLYLIHWEPSTQRKGGVFIEYPHSHWLE